MNRREFLAGAGALTVAILLPGVTREAYAAGTQESRLGLKPDQLSSYISINQDGSITGWTGKVDMSQGTDIGWIKMIAEELDVSTDRVSIVQGHTEQTVDQGGASGSTGIWFGGIALRNAAAEARLVLLEIAAAKFGIAVDGLKVDNGIVSAGDKKISYGELIGGRHFDVQLVWNKEYGNELKVEGRAKPKAPADYKTVGKPGTRRRDIASKVFGSAENMNDVKLPGMLHGRMIRPPVAGAVPVAVDESSVKNIPGVKVVWQKDFLGLVAPKQWDAIRAARQLKVTWSDVKPPFPEQKEIYNHIRAGKSMKRDEDVKANGDVEAAFAGAAKIVEASYEWPFHSHASMSPACGVADVRDGEAFVWTGGQKPHYCRAGIAKMFDMPVEKVKVTFMTGPGSYGRNDSGDATMDAAVLSKAVGKPVRVQGMRHDGTQWDPKSPASVHVSRAALDKDGKVIGWQFESKGFSRREFHRDEGSPERTMAGQLTGWPLKPIWILGVPAESYSFAKRKTSDTIAPLVERASPLRTSHMRDPGGPQIHFASESFMDELALATNMDAVDFRLKYLSNPRDIAVVKTVAEKAGWQAHVGARKQSRGDVYLGQGLAYAVRGGTRVAIIAEVEVHKKTHRVWVKRFVVAHDCGLVIAPDLARQALEAQIVQTTSRALFEEVKFNNKTVTSVDWQSYPILDMKDAPEAIDITLMDRPDITPSGVGEGTCRPLPAAIANAIFDATGARLRQAPFTPARLKAALA
jgi:CO/xanthine dehydrogenase Mo-binding subunit